MDNDILAQLISYVGGELNVPVYSEVPAVKPDAFVTIGPSGGTFDRFVQMPLFSVVAYECSDLAASTLLAQALAVVLEANEHIALVCLTSVQSTYRAGLEDMHGWAATVQVVANRY